MKDRREYYRQYYIKHRLKRQKYYREYYHKNREKIRARRMKKHKASKKALKKKEPWHPQVHESAKKDGRKPEEFNFEQWKVSKVALSIRYNRLVYTCMIDPATPQANQYDGTKKLPDPVGIALSWVKFTLKLSDGSKKILDEASVDHIDGVCSGRAPDKGGDLWNTLTPGTSIPVTLTAQPFFYFLSETGGVQGQYSNKPNGYFWGKTVTSKKYTVLMDADGNITLNQ